MKTLLYSSLAALTALLLLPSLADAAPRLCDARYQDCRAPLLSLINSEPAGGGIDVAFWFMTDDRYRQALKNALLRGVRVRVLVDPRANATKPGNETILNNLAAAGIPMRKKVNKVWGDILHWKMMLFDVQKTVEFSGANYAPDMFVPFTPYKNYIDEVIYTTDDARLVNTFRTKFENYWVDTTGGIVDYANMDVPQSFDTRARYYAIHAQDPALNFPPTQNYATRAVGDYNSEIAVGPPNAKIDAIMYRISDARHADAMIRAAKAGIPVRLITEQENYRDGRYIWHSYNVDRMHAAGVQVKDHIGGKVGINHQKSVMLYAKKEVIFGSSNWSSAAATQSIEHNLFSKPCAPGQATWCDANNAFFNYFVSQFNSKWNSVNGLNFTEFNPFVPKPGGTPANAAPALGATGVSTTVTLKWDGGNWNHKYDVYLGTSSTGMPKIASDIMVGSPYTGQSETWQVPFTLSPGTTYYWKIVGKTMADIAKTGPTWSFTTAGAAADPVSAPFTGTPIPLPGTIQAENFDNGGAGVAYADSTPGNTPGKHRNNTDVDIAASTDAGGGFNLGYTAQGEWLNYTVSVPSGGTYTLIVRYANVGTGAAVRVEVDGVNKSGSLPLQDTGGWQSWRDIEKTGITLASGTYIVRLVFEKRNTQNSAAGNINYLKFTAGSSSQSTAFGGVPADVPGTIQLEKFDSGGEGVAYHDTTRGNSGSSTYRMTDVDLAPTSDTGGGVNVGYARAGEWLKYTVNVAISGIYTLALRYANVGTGARMHVEVNGVDRTGPLVAQDTGGWQNWRTLSVAGISLSAGTHMLTLRFDAANSQNGASSNVNYLTFTAGGESTALNESPAQLRGVVEDDV